MPTNLLRTYPRRMLLVLAALVTSMLLATACTSDSDSGITFPTPTVTKPAVEPERPTIGVELPDVERAALVAAFESIGYASTDAREGAAVAIADRTFPDAVPVIARAWVAITDQRRDVHELTSEQVHAILTGAVTDWSELGGTEQPITPYVASEDREGIAAALGIDAFAPATRDATSAQIVEEVESVRGAFALVSAAQLRIGVLALIVDGHDPYRHRAIDSPMRSERWILTTGDISLEEVLAAAGWEQDALLTQPISVLGTGDIIPVRCSNRPMEAAGNYGMMFDGTRELLQSRDLVIVPLDAGLTARSQSTPCTPSFVLQSQPAVADAMAEAGIDVVSTATNHHMDCYDDCSGYQTHFDTVEAIERAGMVSVGSGENLQAARQPVFVERHGVTFGILAYDAIATYYFATDESPGTAPLSWDTIEDIRDDVARAVEQADHVIVAISWSVEYVTQPQDLMRAAAQAISEAGATLIIGSHPHIVQASELFDEMAVFYALGNFVFDQDWSIPPGSDGLSNWETLDNIVLEVSLSPERIIGFRLHPAVIRDLRRPELVDLTGFEGQRILNRFWDATDELALSPQP